MLRPPPYLDLCATCGTPRIDVDVVEGKFTSTHRVCPDNDCENYSGLPRWDVYGNGTLVPSDHWGKGCPEDCEVHHG